MLRFNLGEKILDGIKIRTIYACFHQRRVTLISIQLILYLFLILKTSCSLTCFLRTNVDGIGH